jgi:hypothetical protein
VAEADNTGGSQALEFKAEGEKEKLGSLGVAVKYASDSSAEIALEAKYLVAPGRFGEEQNFQLTSFKQLSLKGGMELNPAIRNWLVPALLGEFSASVLSIEVKQGRLKLGAGFDALVGMQREPRREGPEEDPNKSEILRNFEAGGQISGEARYQFRNSPFYIFISGTFKVVAEKEQGARWGVGFAASAVGGVGVTLSRSKE